LSPNSASPTRSLKNTYQDLREIPLLDDSPRETPKQKITLTRTSSDTSLESIPDEDEDCEKIEEEQENLFQDVLSPPPPPTSSLFPVFSSPLHSPAKSRKSPSRSPILGSSRSQEEHRVHLEWDSSPLKKKDQEKEKKLDIGESYEKSDPQSVSNRTNAAEVKLTYQDSKKDVFASNENLLPTFEHLKEALTIPIAPIDGTTKLNVVLEKVLTNEYPVPRRSRAGSGSRYNKSNVQIVAELARLESEVDEEIKVLVSHLEDKDQLDAEMELKKRLAIIEEQLGLEFQDLEEEVNSVI